MLPNVGAVRAPDCDRTCRTRDPCRMPTHRSRSLAHRRRTTSDLSLPIRFRDDDLAILVRGRPKLARLLLALGAEPLGHLLPLGPHPVVHGLTDVLGQVHPLDAHVHDLEPELVGLIRLAAIRSSSMISFRCPGDHLLDGAFAELVTHTLENHFAEPIVRLANARRRPKCRTGGRPRFATSRTNPRSRSSSRT